MASLKPAISIVLDLEAGYAVVSGIPTNKGITWPTFQRLAKSTLGIAPTEANFRKLTNSQVAKIMEVFWAGIKGNSINSQAVGMYIFDWYWATGNKAITRVQDTLNKYFGEKLPGTIVFGNLTLAAVNRASGAQLLKYLHKERWDDYSKLSLAEGLHNRLETLYDLLRKKYLESPYVPGVVSRVLNNVYYNLV